LIRSGRPLFSFEQFGFDQQLFGPTLDQLEVVFHSAHANLYGFCLESFWWEGFLLDCSVFFLSPTAYG
jgi:hypothetical protein